MAHARAVLVAALSLIAVGSVGCMSFSSNPKDIEAFLKPDRVNVSTDTYVLQPPDVIEVQCLKVPEIHLQRQQIRPDGKVSFQALGEIEAAGKTIEQLANALQAKVAELYRVADQKSIDVRVLKYEGAKYYVLGQVYLEGPKTYTGRDTLLTAVAEAKPNPMAWKKRIQVIRPSREPDVRPRIFEVNFEDMIVHGDTSKDVLLQEGDIVYVPPTVLASIAMVIEEFARPIGRAFSTVNIVTYGTAGAVGGYGAGY